MIPIKIIIENQTTRPWGEVTKAVGYLLESRFLNPVTRQFFGPFPFTGGLHIDTQPNKNSLRLVIWED